MKKCILIICLISFFSFPVHAKSDCEANEQNCWDCGKTENDLCTARLNTSTKELSITGTGEMRDYEHFSGGGPHGWGHSNTPWGYNFTSVSVDGVQSIGDYAFEYSSVTSVSIADSVTSIGHGATGALIYLKNINIPDSVTYLGNYTLDALAWGVGGTDSVFIPDSVTSIGNHLFNNAKINSIYCHENLNLRNNTSNYDNSKIKTYTKDQNGVYMVDGKYYASPDDMISQTSCGTGQTAPQNCIDAAKIYQEQKALSMAGGALCQTKEGCLKLIEMANKKQVCTSIADCKAYGNAHGISFAESVHQAKRIYSIKEANEALGTKNKNMFSIRYR